LVGTDEVEQVLGDLADRVAALDRDLRRAVLPARRSLEVVFADLGVSYHSTLEQGELRAVEQGSLARPDVRLTANSDDLLALANGDLPLGAAYADGRVKVEASMLDLLRLRALL
jgi:predicted lipid carrier protein YhbT